MTSPLKKADFINDAYSQLRISGITVDPTPSDLSLALDRLEDIAAELFSRNMDAGYMFEEVPDINSNVGVSRQYKQAYVTLLALRLIPDFNIAIPQHLQMAASAAVGALAANQINVREMVYPNRQPLGSGNLRRWTPVRRYYPGDVRGPAEDSTHKLFVGDTNDYTVDLSSDFVLGETITTFTLQTSSALQLDSSSNTDQTITYRVTALAAKTDKAILTVTTSTGRVLTREIWFELIEASLL